jgi:Kef-type K+ transport system membrane component KefB
MQLLYSLLIVLVASRLLAEVAARFGEPALVGELTAGIGLGLLAAHFSDAFPVLSSLDHDPVFRGITDLAMFFLMILAGVEMRPRDIVGATRVALPVALAGIGLPMALGFGLGWWFFPASQWRVAQSLFIAVALAVTAVPVTVKVLMDLGRQNSRPGTVIISAALFDDVFSLALLAVLTAMARRGALPDTAEALALAGQIGVFFALAYLLSRRLLPLLGAAAKRWRLEEAEFTLLLVWGLTLSLLGELLEMHFIIGAFAAGLAFNRGTVDRRAYEKLLRSLRAVTVGFLAPVFFASIGFHLRLDVFVQAPLFLTALVLAAFLGKLLGAGLAARGLGLPGREAMAVGVGMNARGAVELVIAGIVADSQLLRQPVPVPAELEYAYSAVIVVAVLTTLVSPVLLRRALA